MAGGDEEGSGSEESVAWIDSDDERLTVSLASNNRLRKLRINEYEDVINGTEYSKRLRQQYERLHPTPTWAVRAAVQKRRKLNGGGKSSSDSEDASDVMSEDDEELAAQPLAKLLRNTDSLTSSSLDLSRNRKLRPEIIDMHRLKDISTIQKVRLQPRMFSFEHCYFFLYALQRISLRHFSFPTLLTTSNPSLPPFSLFSQQFQHSHFIHPIHFC